MMVSVRSVSLASRRAMGRWFYGARIGSISAACAHGSSARRRALCAASPRSNPAQQQLVDQLDLRRRLLSPPPRPNQQSKMLARHF